MQIKVNGTPFRRLRKKSWVALFTMKLVIILTMTFCLQAGAHGYGQTISLTLTNAPLEIAFKEIKKQTGFRFVYTRTEMQASRPVTVRFTNKSMTEALDILFSGQPLDYIIETNHVVIRRKSKVSPVTGPIPPQEISGKVMAEDGLPIAGASVVVKGSGMGVSTNASGEFSLQGIRESDLLIISSVGYQTREVAVGKQTRISIVLSLVVNSLDETVVIAYGKTTRRYSTGTVGSVKKEEIDKQPVSNPLAVLTGRISGLQVSPVSGTTGAAYIIKLRGQNSIANGNDPLIIVDGIPYPTTPMNYVFGGGTISSPLANIDPSTIESIEVLKDADATAIYGSRGANGVILITTQKAKQGKTKVQSRIYSGFGKATRLMDLLNTPQYIAMRKEAFANDGTTPTSSNARDLLLWDTTRYTDWQKELIGNTMNITDSKIDISGGTDKTQFLAGIGYHRETTVLPDNHFGEKKYAVSLRVNHTSSSGRFRLNFQSSYVRNRINLPQTDISSQIFLPPDAPSLYKEDGSLNWENSSWVNPISLLYKEYITTNENLLSNLKIGFTVLPGLEFASDFGYSVMNVSDHSVTPQRSFDPAFTSPSVAGFGSNKLVTQITEPQLNYIKSFSKWRLQALLGLTAQENRAQLLYQSGTGYASDDLLGSRKAAAVLTTSAESDIKYRYIGIFSRFNIDWDRRYLVSFTARRDGSSRYGPANRFASFGSAGVGWIFTNEKWLSKNKVISYGKLKLSYGSSGNDQIGDYKYMDLYSPGANTYQGVIPFTPVQLHSAGYSWELVKKFEAALDFAMLQDKLQLGVRFYNNTTNNQLLSYALPVITGFSGILQNLPAKIRNSGIEADLNAILVKSKNINWSVSANFTVPYNKLLRYDNIASSSYANTYVVGKSLFIAKRYFFTGVNPATGNYTFEDIDRDGKISSPNDQQSVVFTGQQFFGGMQHLFSWKKLSMSFLVQFVRNKNASNYLARFGRPGSFSNQPTLVLGRWQNAGDISNIQKFAHSNALSNVAYNNYRNSDAAFSDASFIRLRNFYLSYDLLTEKLKTKGVEACSVFMQGQNLFTITNYESMDPETKSVMPPVKIVTIGLHVNL